MFENTSLDQFSALEELSAVTPVWRPFVQQTARVPVVSQESRQESAECAH
ncbi:MULTISPECIES: hypothetical protein [unclassified Caballeronia]|nr:MULTISPECIES: hypothetical protein [unclassified Caballeronia]MDR5818112.1 hypothetical protein [Caballeronia sp. LZ033]MDR5825078.1 hypothetical protein [Caballeronia sp. LZ043]MDR5882952.1 hypothetical protein [Caballeronia sp. LZ032]